MPDTPPAQQSDPPPSALPVSIEPPRRSRWQRTVTFIATAWTVAGKVLWAAAIAVIGLLLYETFQVTTAIEPIAVPKALADAGFTPEVAALRLRDALTEFATDAEKELKSSKFSLRAEMPNIVVPTVGISVDTITSSILRVFRNSGRQTIGGEFTVRNSLLWLHLRIDGQSRYTSKGVDPEKPHELLADAAPAIFDIIEPYFVAASFRQKDPSKALEIAHEIIARWPDTDKRAAPLYDLKGSIYLDLMQPAKAVVELEKAIRIDPSLQYAHRDLGNALFIQGKYPEAKAAYSEAIRRNDVPAHLGLGDVYNKQEEYDEARASYQRAIELVPKFAVADDKVIAIVKAGARSGLGDILLAGKNYQEAQASYREAAKLFVKSGAASGEADAYTRLGNAFFAEKKYDQAEASYREAAKLALKSGAASSEALAHNGLGTSLYGQKKYTEALAAYLEAARLSPDDSVIRTNLGDTLLALKNKEAAISEFKKALELDPKNDAAGQSLAKATK